MPAPCQVLEALVDEAGRVFLHEPARFARPRRALLIVLDDEMTPAPNRIPAFIPGLQHEGARRYRIDQPLGAGGMGQTFLGTDTHTGRTVCIKRLRAGFRNEIIVQEWRSLSRVDSPYVVRFLDWYEH